MLFYLSDPAKYCSAGMSYWTRPIKHVYITIEPNTDTYHGLDGSSVDAALGQW